MGRDSWYTSRRGTTDHVRGGRGADVRTRRLGRTGLMVSEIGFGGAPAGLANYLDTWDPASAAAADQIVQTIRRAVDLGVTYFDSAPGHGAGRSEEMLGLALQGRREGVIVATKVTGED